MCNLKIAYWICSAVWGNFTLPLAKQAASVVGVEGVPALVEKGQQNARLNGLQNVTFYHENLEEDVTKAAVGEKRLR